LYVTYLYHLTKALLRLSFGVGCKFTNQ